LVWLQARESQGSNDDQSESEWVRTPRGESGGPPTRGAGVAAFMHLVIG
jgi:hypothetical protein